MALLQGMLKSKAGLLGVHQYVRSLHTSRSLQSDTMEEWWFNMCGYNRLGLLKDDLLSTSDSIIDEAVRRLPEELQLQRKYRFIRACQCDINHVFLPKNLWTKLNDDHNYLQPYIKEIEAEINEKKDWDANH